MLLRKPLRGIGDRIVPLDSVFPLTVVFIIGLRRDRNGVERPTPIGTGFIVSVPMEALPDHCFVYVVTAAHVVEAERESWVRFNQMAGGISDVAVPDWTCHPKADVAASRVTLTTGLRMKHLPLDVFVDRDLQAELGDRVYFVGLLNSVAAMGAENIPMVRSGTLGRFYQRDVRMKRADGTEVKRTAHLIDCRSYAGFSGSPCFVQYDRTRLHYSDPTTLVGSRMEIEHDTALVGLISGHFDDWVGARTTGDVLGAIQTQVNTGVGIVTPAEMIRETLELEELVEVRDKRNEELLSGDSDEGTAATLDSTARNGGNEFGRFEDLARQLVQVPKGEIDEKRKDES